MRHWSLTRTGASNLSTTGTHLIGTLFGMPSLIGDVLSSMLYGAEPDARRKTSWHFCWTIIIIMKFYTLHENMAHWKSYSVETYSKHYHSSASSINNKSAYVSVMLIAFLSRSGWEAIIIERRHAKLWNYNTESIQQKKITVELIENGKQIENAYKTNKNRKIPKKKKRLW